MGRRTAPCRTFAIFQILPGNDFSVFDWPESLQTCTVCGHKYWTYLLKASKSHIKTLEVFAPPQKHGWKLLLTTSSPLHVECLKATAIWPLEIPWHLGIDCCVKVHPHNCLTTLELPARGVITGGIAMTSLFFFPTLKAHFWCRRRCGNVTWG